MWPLANVAPAQPDKTQCKWARTNLTKHSKTEVPSGMLQNSRRSSQPAAWHQLAAACGSWHSPTAAAAAPRTAPAPHSLTARATASLQRQGGRQAGKLSRRR